MLSKKQEGDQGVNDVVPMVTAVNVDHQDAIYIHPDTVASTPLTTTATPVVAVAFPASGDSSGFPAAHIADAPAPPPAVAMNKGADRQSAMYFKNPTQEMIEQSYHTSKISAGIMFIQSPRNFKGKFTLAKSVTAGHIMSGDTIDLSMVDFIHPVTKIMVSALMGGVHVIVPRGVRVQTNGLGIMGSFRGIRSGQTVHAGQDAPLVILNGLAIMGGVDVRVNEDVPPVRIIY